MRSWATDTPRSARVKMLTARVFIVHALYLNVRSFVPVASREIGAPVRKSRTGFDSEVAVARKPRFFPADECTRSWSSANGPASHRACIRDLGLVFAKPTGDPLQSNNLGEREFSKLVDLAGVEALTLRGLRRTSATLALKAGTPPHVVSERLGHKKIEITLNIYAHALPSMQKDAAAKRASLL